MKVAFLTRVDAFDKNGGDTYQIQMYKKYFEKNGHEALIVTDLSIPDKCDYYILVNMDRPLELIAYYEKLKRLDRTSKVLFLSIHHSYKAINYFESKVRGGNLGVVFKMISSFHRREKIKNIARALKYKNLFIPSIIQCPLDYEQKIKEIICNVRSVILIAEGEKDTIEFDYNTLIADSFVVRNGVELTEVSELNYKKDKDIDVLVCGRIESRKNSLAIAKYFKNTQYRITFVGAINSNDKEYGEQFQSLINSCENITYLGRVDPGEMPAIYLRSKIHLSASWFEVASLVDLEAYAYGCHVISSIHGHTNSYLGDRATYLDPSKLSDIFVIIDELKIKESNLIEQYNFISSYFSWEKSYESLYSSLNKLG
ncbi:glycosyl transferase group 1 [Raoultella ornithinolytica]|uniref:glycosyltransferase family 4 protein n=1 Tax=Raoultella ornithinolytica TaxID=54291 RepID=UPI00071FF1F9|nr:glycosyltransferase family 4 protein [Raoultella ornithinolytica]ALQ45838.1 glycosyl transferase group 1 [Raoultella ornithinolytica]